MFWWYTFFRPFILTYLDHYIWREFFVDRIWLGHGFLKIKFTNLCPWIDAFNGVIGIIGLTSAILFFVICSFCFVFLCFLFLSFFELFEFIFVIPVILFIYRFFECISLYKFVYKDFQWFIYHIFVYVCVCVCACVYMAYFSLLRQPAWVMCRNPSLYSPIYNCLCISSTYIENHIRQCYNVCFNFQT